jgi:DNA-directed RNA polymerase specialized sigma24 family protein
MEITDEHMDQARSAARQLARKRTALAQKAGVDELESVAVSALWDLARAYDPDHHSETPFPAYVNLNIHRRIIDWARSEYGYNGTVRQHGNHTTYSYDERDPEEPLAFPSQAPSPEHEAVTRVHLRETIQVMRDVCTEKQVAALLEPLGRADDDALAAEMGVGKVTVHTHRNHGRKRLREALRATTGERVHDETTSRRAKRPGSLGGQRRRARHPRSTSS